MPRWCGRGGKSVELSVISLLLVAVVLRLGHLLYLLWYGRGEEPWGLRSSACTLPRWFCACCSYCSEFKGAPISKDAAPCSL